MTERVAMTLTHDELTKLVLETLRDTLRERGADPDQPIRAETNLYGTGGLLDSLGIATLVMEIEVRLEERHAMTVVLADDRAMSRRSSPFATLASLTKYIEDRLAKAADG